ncbi:MAG: PEP-utilizing enzyme [bacterium]|nr:PEP-utilizing enzyme [bacterium]
MLANGVVLDGRNHLSNKIREELMEILGNPKNFEEYWSLLTQVTKMSLRQIKEHEIALLAKQAKRMGRELINQKLKKLHERYCWLDYNNMGTAASLEQFKSELWAAIRSNVHINLPQQLVVLKKKQQQLIKKLKLNRRGKFLIKLAQGVIWQKGYRKDMQYHGFYCYENLFRELARRNKTNDWRLFSYLFPWEVEDYILKGRPTVVNLNERRSYSCFVVTRKEKSIKTGKEAHSLVKRLGLTEDFSNLKEVKGQCAFLGKVIGNVKIIQVPADITKMKAGDILVSQATSPDLLPAMRKAKAIVTNTGGLICHAAIVARELKIPCVVGTAKATLVFKDGDRVEVDAGKGVVKKLSRS